MTIEAMKHYEAALLEAFPRGASGDVFYHWNKARQAIEQAEKQVCVGCEGNPQGENIPCAVCGATPQPQREWVGLIRGVRVDGDTVVITVKGGNEAARKLCAELLKEKNT